MVIVLGVIQFFIISFITAYEFKNKSPVVFLWGTLLLMFGIMHMITSITGDFMFPESVLNEASFFVIIFSVLYFLFRVFFIKANKISLKKVFRIQNIQNSLDEKTTYSTLLFLVFIFVMLLKLVPLIQYVGDIFSTSWGAARSYSSSLGYVNTEQIARIIIYSLSGLTAVLILIKDRRWIIVSGLLLFGVLLTRNRIEILPLICSLISIYIYKHDKLKLSTIFVTIVLSLVVLDVVYALRVFRHYGTIQNFLDGFNFSDFQYRLILQLQNDSGELGLRRVFYFFINGDNEFENFGKMHTYIRMMLVYLPTSWSFGLKPDDFAQTMGHAIGMSEGGSTHPTLFGDCYANLGIFGFLLGIFWAFYANVSDMIIAKRKNMTLKILLFVLNAVVYVIIGRGSVYNSFWFVAYGVPLLLFFEWIVNCFRFPSFKIKFIKAKKNDMHLES